MVRVALGEPLDRGVIRVGFCHAFFQFLSCGKVTILIFVAGPTFPERPRTIRRKGANNALKQRTGIIFIVYRQQETQIVGYEVYFVAEGFKSFLEDPGGGADVLR
jgi:hypothetical protein